jgi:serpin B
MVQFFLTGSWSASTSAAGANLQRYATAVDANNAFAVDLYQQLRRRESTFCFSPYATINEWMREQTAGRITNIGEPPGVSGTHYVVLCSAMYLKCPWLTAFDRKASLLSPFYIESTQSVQVVTMRTTARVRIAELDDVTILGLPYASRLLSMVLVLPARRDGFADLEQHLTPERLSSLLTQIKQQQEEKIYVILPRWRTSCSIDISRSLSQMGMGSLFTQAGCDLSGITGNADTFVSGVPHRATIDVSEEGTEISAATTVHVRSMGGGPSFSADHPFLYLIIENQSGCILLMGRVLSPSQT